MEVFEIFDQLASPEFHKFLDNGLCEAYDCSECPFLKECYHKGGASRIYLTREEVNEVVKSEFHETEMK